MVSFKLDLFKFDFPKIRNSLCLAYHYTWSIFLLYQTQEYFRCHLCTISSSFCLPQKATWVNLFRRTDATFETCHGTKKTLKNSLRKSQKWSLLQKKNTNN